jgi:hypothetical protein
MTKLSMTQPEMRPDVDAALQQLFAATRELLSTDSATAEAFLSALPQSPFLHQTPEGETGLPVCRFWSSCLESTSDESVPDRSPLTRVAAALGRLTPSLRWRQNPNYRQSPPSESFLASYGYAELCGSYGLIEAEIRFGVLVLGPGTCYPPHRHPAEEIYIPLGRGEWQRGEADVDADRWIEQPAGRVIHHPPFVPHATRGLKQPLAALYLWRGDLATEAKLDPTPTQV